MRIAVTGAGGFIGRALTISLADSGHEVLALDNNARGHLKSLPRHERIRPQGCDVLDTANLCEVTRGINAIYHLAYINGTKNFYTIPERILEVGILGTHNILKACLENKVPHFFLASSSEVYQQASLIPTPEEVEMKIPDILNPRYSYGGGKIACELLTVNYLRKSDTRWVIFRPHNVYGPQMGTDHVIPELIQKILSQKALTPSQTPVQLDIQGTGAETRAFIYIDDAIRAVETCTLKNQESGIYHLGVSDEIRIRDLILLLAKILDVTLSIKTSESPKGSTPRRCPDTSKLQKLGFRPEISLEEGLRRTAAWYRENQPQKETL